MSCWSGSAKACAHDTLTSTLTHTPCHGSVAMTVAWTRHVLSLPQLLNRSTLNVVLAAGGEVEDRDAEVGGAVIVVDKHVPITEVIRVGEDTLAPTEGHVVVVIVVADSLDVPLWHPLTSHCGILCSRRVAPSVPGEVRVPSTSKMVTSCEALTCAI